MRNAAVADKYLVHVAQITNNLPFSYALTRAYQLQFLIIGPLALSDIKARALQQKHAKQSKGVQ